MVGRIYRVALLALTVFAAPLGASTTVDFDGAAGGDGYAARQQPFLQCVPYAREVSGLQIYGDALTWWGQAEGRYARGHEPRVGAVMAFRPYGNMRLGHVAAVSRIIDSRTVLVRHANWSPIDGRRGQIEDDVRAVDVSPNNDWSEVRVWFAPIQALGATHWPLDGFIYNEQSNPITLAQTSAEKTRPIAKLAVQPRSDGPAKPLRLARGDDPIGQIIASSRH
jgi:surface antigen